MIRLLILAALLGLSGCGAAALPWVVAAGGILTGTAAVTNADVGAFQAYIDWRKASGMPAPASTGLAAPMMPADTN